SDIAHHRCFPHDTTGSSCVRFAPVWVRARGGAVGKRAVGGKSAPPAGQAQEEDGEAEEAPAEEDDAGAAAGAAAGVEEDDVDEAAAAGEGGEDAGDEAEEKDSEPSGQEASVMDTVDLKVVLPQAIKQLAFFLLARWLNKSLSPTVESQVRAARAIYTVYLIVSQALCMYIRYLIWKKDDDTEVEVPPPAQLKKLIQDAGKAGVTGNEGAPATTTGGAGGAASPLGPVMDKMMTSRMAVKKYDMKFIQGVRRRQFWASLMMCYTHLRRGMIKPMMFQV
ncbi:unnamed protein product, partial [Ectocarpus sp. 8 AP-2014]